MALTAHDLLTPNMRGVLDRIHRAARPPLHTLSPAQAREFYEAGASLLDMAPQPVDRVEDLRLPARDGESLRARLYAPHKNHSPALLYLHGGGFTIGSLNTHDRLCRSLSQRAQCAVLALDYRLAPEHQFPAAVNDAWDALQWLHAHAAALGLDPQRLAIGGDSAGGTLAAVCAILARNASLSLRLQLLFYPGCGGHQATPSHQQFGHGFMLDTDAINWMFAQYLPTAQDRNDWRFAPLDGVDERGHLIDLEGVAPAWFGLAECDPLVDEGVAYADRLRLAGVAVDLEIYRGVVHNFIQMGRVIPQALTAHADAAHMLKLAFGSG